MSRLTNLIQQAKAKDPQLGADLEAEFRVLSGRRPFGLNFERHRPEAVELPSRPIRRGDKVRILPPRGSTERGDRRLWRVDAIERSKTGDVASLSLIDDQAPESTTSPVADLVVVAEFRDPIYPGLVATGRVERGTEDQPFHTIINGENFHVLEALTYTHRGRIDAIYIDPPYNTGARDWKYNNDYVEGDDMYRHSKWLAFMERRLQLAKVLLKPDNSVLIVTIDEKEVHRLGLLLEQLFPDARMQLVTIVIQSAGSNRQGELGRVEEYAFFLFFGAVAPYDWTDDLLNEAPSTKVDKVRWESLLRGGTGSNRSDSPNLFYPVFVSKATGAIVGCGDSRAVDVPRSRWDVPDGATAVFPLKSGGIEGRWRCTPDMLRSLADVGLARAGKVDADGKGTIWYLGMAARKKIRSGEFAITGTDQQGASIVSVVSADRKTFPAKTVWSRARHHAGWHGTNLVSSILPGRRFPFPKSLYAVEDALRIVIGDKPEAIVLDFFAGSGTTAHAVMRLNKQDNGRRQCISVTNNEVAADEQAALLKQGLRPGDADWERWGICDYITKPRIEAAITGRTPEGEPIRGDYKFTDEFPMADGFFQNAEFFTLTYENPLAVEHNRAFERVAPLLWLRAGAQGRRIEHIPDDSWDVAGRYGILFDCDKSAEFIDAMDEEGAVLAYIVTDDDRRFQSVAARLPDDIEPVRLYESYLTNFKLTGGEQA